MRAGTVQGVFRQIVTQANSVGVPQKYTLATQQAEDDSLEVIQYVTPGLLSWAIAMGAAFGAAATLVTWREKRILRRPRLAPVSTASVVGARVLVSVVIALIQMAIFLAVASLPFFGAATGRLVVDGDPAGRRRDADVHGDRHGGRRAGQVGGGGGGHLQPDRAADGVPVGGVHPARLRARAGSRPCRTSSRSSTSTRA